MKFHNTHHTIVHACIPKCIIACMLTCFSTKGIVVNTLFDTQIIIQHTVCPRDFEQYFQSDNHRVREHASEVQNLFFSKCYIEGQKIKHQEAQPIQPDLAKLAKLISWWFLYSPIQDFMKNAFQIHEMLFQLGSVYFKGFAILSKIISTYIVCYAQ